MNCINLQEKFGHKYLVTIEENGKTQGKWKSEDRVWLQEIKCKRGIIAPYGSNTLQACSFTAKTGNMLRKLPFVLSARGDEETVITFSVDNMKEVCKIIKPYRQRQLTDEQKAIIGERLKKARELRGVNKMPIFEFFCKKCKRAFERLTTVNVKEAMCPECKQVGRKILSKPGIVRVY